MQFIVYRQARNLSSDFSFVNTVVDETWQKQQRNLVRLSAFLEHFPFDLNKLNIIEGELGMNTNGKRYFVGFGYK